jgi:membrane protease YdiL (CAAX protease family)
MNLIKRAPSWSIILVSAICFALPHNYSWLYIFYTFLGGIISATTFLVFKIKRGYTLAFWFVFLIHVLHNTTVFIVDKVQLG